MSEICSVPDGWQPYDEDDLYTKGWLEKGYPVPPTGKKYTRKGKLVAGSLKPFLRRADGGTWRGKAPEKKIDVTADEKKAAITPSLAYMRISQIPYEQVKAIAETEKLPKSWPFGKQSIYVRCAKEWVLAHKNPIVSEINSRIEGPVIQKQELLLGPNSDLARLLAGVRPPAAAIRQEERPALPAIDAEVVPA